MDSKTPNFNKKIQPILDAMQPGEKTCQFTGRRWTMTDEEISWYKKFKVPHLDIAPLTRVQCMMAYFTGFAWRQSKHWKTGQSVLSCVHPGTGITVLPDIEWFEEEFTDQCQDIDERLFFEQLHDLRLKVPMSASRSYVQPENSVAMASRGDVNSYFMIATQSKNCFYGCATGAAESSIEFYNCHTISNSYNILHSQRIYNCKFLRECFDCLNCSFLFDCRNCENCFGAWNKRNAKYLWWNEQLSQSEWETKFKEVNLRSRKETDAHLHTFQQIL
ncbi:MAG: hypothetical protein ABIH21_01790, partial [Patescibacteria group bacterium]